MRIEIDKQEKVKEVPSSSKDSPVPLLWSCALLFLGICLHVNPVKGAGQGTSPPNSNSDSRTRPATRAARISSSPRIDGVVDEVVWTAVEPATGFIQKEPNNGMPATEETEVRVAYDDDYLYLGVICYDREPDQIVVTQNRRDGNLTDTDSVQILLDTFRDKQNAFIFGTSPTGIEYDAQVSKAGQGRGGAGAPARAGGVGGQGGAQQAGAAAVNINWDGVWIVRSQITSRGWEAEFQIPFRTLRYRPGSREVWGMNVQRNLRRRNEQSFWAPLSRAYLLTQVEMAGAIEQLDLRPHHNLQLLPYVLGGFIQDYTNQADTTQPRFTGGLDVKYSLTPSLTVDGTFNTDFAQVEVNDEQINLTRFDLFFPEKRPFFLENSGTFDFGAPQVTEIFFSRRIGIDDTGIEIPIDAGIRLTGKAAKFNLGCSTFKPVKFWTLLPLIISESHVSAGNLAAGVLLGPSRCIECRRRPDKVLTTSPITRQPESI